MTRSARIGFLQVFYVVLMGLGPTFPSKADTSLQVALESCSWQEKDAVVCSFALESPQSANFSITGGQYSVGVDGSGNAWHATGIKVGKDSGLAVWFDVAPGSPRRVEVWFSGVDRSVEKFATLTLRFNDGYWQASDVTVNVH